MEKILPVLYQILPEDFKNIIILRDTLSQLDIFKKMCHENMDFISDILSIIC